MKCCGIILYQDTLIGLESQENLSTEFAVIYPQALHMVFANDIRLAILKVAENRGKHSFSTYDVARELDAHNWKRLEDQVRFVADVLVREGKLTMIQSEKPLDNGIVNPMFRKT